MKKTIACILLMLLFTFFGQQMVQMLSDSVREKADYWQKEINDVQVPTFTEQLGTQGASDTLDVTLYFRYEDTGLLGARQARLDIRREETVATSIIQQLIAGPQAASGRLQGVFPQGTRLVSVSAEGLTAFVTLSRDFLGKPDGAPADWEDMTQWQEEATLRRMLAVQSIVLSLTEDGRYQRVQLYVADYDDDVPERIPLAYFSLDVQSSDVVLAACSRDESFLLTPQRALNHTLDCWQRKDWAALYAMLADGDEELPTQAAFEEQMRGFDVSLLEYETTVGSVSFDGQRSTLVLNAQISTSDGGNAKLTREAVPLRRCMDNWAMTYDTLLDLMVRE